MLRRAWCAIVGTHIWEPVEVTVPHRLGINEYRKMFTGFEFCRSCMYTRYYLRGVGAYNYSKAREVHRGLQQFIES